MNNKRVIVVGGGAAGLMAAGQAAESGAKVILIEKQSRVGHKLSITGKGRCNLTNIAPLPEFITHFGNNGRFLRQAFNRFFSTDLAAFLGELGVNIITERGGRVFPEGENAPAVVEALVAWVKDKRVATNLNAPVKRLLITDGKIAGVRTADKEVPADSVIIATGGVSYPATGSTGDGYRLAESVGHNIVPIRPALIPLKTAGDVAKRLQGVSLRNVKVTVLADGKKHDQAFGEMIFAHYGMSGPIILTLSSKVVDGLSQNKNIELSLDLKPALDNPKLDARLIRELQSQGKRQFRTMLKSLLPGKLIDVCCDLVGIAPEKTCDKISASERKQLRLWLKDFRFKVTGHRLIDEAIVTAGGVDLKEVNPRTMESKLMPGLFFAGEVLDLNGDTGGYNLQAAFSTGWLAGRSAAEAGI